MTGDQLPIYYKLIVNYQNVLKTVHLVMQLIIQELEIIIREYTALLRLVSEEDLSAKPAPSKWSGKEFLGHLIDSAQNNIRRYIVAQYQNKPHIIYDQEKWVSATGYQNYPVNDLIDLWTLINKHLVIVLKNIPETAFTNEVQTQEIHTIKWLAADYNKHLLHHLHQVLNLDPVSYP